MKIVNVFLLFVFASIPNILNAQKLSLSYNVDIGYAHYVENIYRSDTKRLLERPSFSMGSRVEISTKSNFFKVESGIFFQQIQTGVNGRQGLYHFTDSGQLVYGFLKNKFIEKRYYWGIPISLNLSFEKSKFKFGLQPLFFIKYISKSSSEFVDIQGNKYESKEVLYFPDSEKPPLGIESFIEFTHVIKNNTWLKIAWYQTRGVLGGIKDPRFPKNRFTLGINQFVN